MQMGKYAVVVFCCRWDAGTFEPWRIVKTDKGGAGAAIFHIDRTQSVYLFIDLLKFGVLLCLVASRVYYLIGPPSSCVACPYNIFCTEGHGGVGLITQLIEAYPQFRQFGVDLQSNPQASVSCSTSIGSDLQIFKIFRYLVSIGFRGINIIVITEIICWNMSAIFFYMLCIGTGAQLTEGLVGGVFCD